MKGYPGRTVFDVMSPKSNALVRGAIPAELEGQQLPTLIVRQRGEAWDRPFVAVYHPYTIAEGPAVKSVGYFGSTGDFVGIAVHSAMRTDYIFNSASGEPEVVHRNMRFKGNYAVIGEINGSGQPEMLFLGDGQTVAAGKWSITSTADNVQASLNRSGDTYELTASGDIILTLPADENRQPELTNIENPDEKLQGSLKDGIFAVQIPKGKYRIKII